jgi:hypothetical protein
MKFKVEEESSHVLSLGTIQEFVSRGYKKPQKSARIADVGV